MNLKFASAWAVLGLCILLSACSRRSPDTLVVGMELSYPPFEMTDAQGNPAGISVDLARDLGKFLGKPVRIENTSFDGLIPALKSGRIDLILSSMTATPERANSVDFSEPYLQTGLCLLVAAKSDLQSIEDSDRPGKIIVVKKGTTGQAYAAEHIHQAQVLVLDKEAACALEVAQGKADAFIYDQMSVFKHWEQNPKTTKALLRPFRQESWAIAVRKGDTQLLKAVNEFIASYRAQHGFEKLGDRWMPEQKKAFHDLGYEFIL